MFRKLAVTTGLALVVSVAGMAQAVDPATRKQADAIFAATGVNQGLVVHVGCGNGHLTAALHNDGACTVQGLDADPAIVNQARSYLKGQGIYGRVTADVWNTAVLPYTEDLVNLLVIEKAGSLTEAEMLRVLVPQGVAYVKQGGSWKKTVKPARQNVDEWTHYNHDASGNPVANDTVVGPPRHLHWLSEPRHTRSHEYTPSIQSLVSSNGRLFHIADQGPIETLRSPSDWKLVARDAYNGLLLWERPLGNWFSRMCGWTSGPRQLERRLVAVGDHVYMTLGYHAPVSALDAATGKTLFTLAGTEGTDEVFCHNGVVLALVRKVTPERLAEFKKWEEMTTPESSPLHLRDSSKPLLKQFRQTENKAPISLLAFDAATGKQLWQKAGKDAAGLRALSVRACGDNIYCQMKPGLTCLDLKTGEQRWAANAWTIRTVSDKAVICLTKKEIKCVSPADGKIVWTQPTVLLNIRDVFLIGDSVWTGGFKPYDSGRKKYTGPVWGPYFAAQRSLKTGEVIGEISQKNPEHHHRCYENKATPRYILGGRRGTEFLDLETGNVLWHSWARGVCRYGVMPCNGMVYTPPHSCGCYITVKLPGFNALAPAWPPTETAVSEAANTACPRLQKGSAYSSGRGAAPAPTDWPTYRADASRSGTATCEVPTTLTEKWQADLGEGLTAPTVANGKVFVARTEQHELLALDTASGKKAWTATADGRIDSPPTIHNGRALFGSADGHVYSVRVTDGELAWRFRGARSPLQITAREQVESASPVHGSVLVDNGVLYFTAGRSSFLDGGLDLYRLNPDTGEKLSLVEIYSPDPVTGQQPAQYNSNRMPGARSEILSADEKHLFLRNLVYDKDGKELDEQVPHLFTLTDFLDSTWPHRSYWIYGTDPSISTGCSGQKRGLTYGRLISFNDTDVYGYGRNKVHWSNEFEDGKYRIFGRGKTADKTTWSVPISVHARAMVLAGETLFAAGPVIAGDTGPAESKEFVLVAISTKDGSELSRCPIDAAPVFNGMAAAAGELFLTLENGNVLCMTGK